MNFVFKLFCSWKDWSDIRICLLFCYFFVCTFVILPSLLTMWIRMSVLEVTSVALLLWGCGTGVMDSAGNFDLLGDWCRRFRSLSRVWAMEGGEREKNVSVYLFCFLMLIRRSSSKGQVGFNNELIGGRKYSSQSSERTEGESSLSLQP